MAQINVGFVGSREYPVSQYWRIHEKITSLSATKSIKVISGGARGVDTVAVEFANSKNIDTEVFHPANGSTKALMGRNTSIIKASDAIYAFWDGVSSGTLDSINKALRQNVPVTIVFPTGLEVSPARESLKWHNDSVFYAYGDMLESGVDAIVNPCNIVGVHGRGLSRAIADKWSWVSGDYKESLRLGNLDIGKLHITHAPDPSIPSIIHFPTKVNWRHPSRLEYVESGLQYFARHYQEWGVDSVALPMLGCGLGGLRWQEVRPYIEQYLSDLPLTIVVYTEIPEKSKFR